MLTPTLHGILDGGSRLSTIGDSPLTVPLRYCQRNKTYFVFNGCMRSSPLHRTSHSCRHPEISHYTHAWLPSLTNSLDFLNKPPTCNLASLDASISHSHRRVFIRHIERVLQQPYIRRLQRLESLVQLVHQHIYTPRAPYCKDGKQQLTPLISPSDNPLEALFTPLPHASTTTANLVPVPVSQPQMLNRSSTICSIPRSWSI